ncbi:hypothetical protein AB9D79_25950, partial [Escherichia coli]
NGDVVSTGDIVNAGEIRFDNQTTPDAALSRAVAKSNSPVTFHKLTTSPFSTMLAPLLSCVLPLRLPPAA